MFYLTLITSIAFSIYVNTWTLEVPLQKLSDQLNQLARMPLKTSVPSVDKEQLKAQIKAMSEKTKKAAKYEISYSKQIIELLNEETESLFKDIETNGDAENQIILQRINQLRDEFEEDKHFEDWYYRQESNRLLYKYISTVTTHADRNQAAERASELISLLNSPPAVIKQEYCKESDACKTQ